MKRSFDPWMVTSTVATVFLIAIGITYFIREAIACEHRGGTLIQGRCLAIETR